MLADAGATYVIVGHSERRQYHKEKDVDVCAKAVAAHRAGLTAIVCVGETREERESGKTLAVVRKQLRGSIPVDSNSHNLVVAYEPVWAIGTGLTPTVADVAEVHALIRDELRRLVGKADAARVRILYGGSVKPSNAAELMAVENVDGALVGGASLVAADFLAIAGAYLGECRYSHRGRAAAGSMPLMARIGRSSLFETAWLWIPPSRDDRGALQRKAPLRVFDPAPTYATGRRNERIASG